MNDCPWDEIKSFNSYGEYKLFSTYLLSQIEALLAEEIVPNLESHRGLVFGGKWFKWKETEELWRLVPPDFPFRGCFEKIDK